jgi:predicted component of type VI protein secretion system
MARAPGHFGLLHRIDGRPVTDEVEEVVQHLGHLLNLKRGYGSFMTDIGLSISDAMWSARPMLTLAQHIREQIAQFEPRLADVQIEPASIDDHYCPCFRVYGTIGSARVRLLLSLHTVYCTVQVQED